MVRPHAAAWAMKTEPNRQLPTFLQAETNPTVGAAMFVTSSRTARYRRHVPSTRHYSSFLELVVQDSPVWRGDGKIAARVLHIKCMWTLLQFKWAGGEAQD